MTPTTSNESQSSELPTTPSEQPTESSSDGVVVEPPELTQEQIDNRCTAKLEDLTRAYMQDVLDLTRDFNYKKAIVLEERVTALEALNGTSYFVSGSSVTDSYTSEGDDRGSSVRTPISNVHRRRHLNRIVSRWSKVKWLLVVYLAMLAQTILVYEQPYILVGAEDIHGTLLLLALLSAVLAIVMIFGTVRYVAYKLTGK